jgi:phosphoesterase RecJ-like protein
MTNQESIASFLRLVHDRRTFVVSSHARPDGDAIGSSLAMMHMLQCIGKEVVVAFKDPIPAQFNCLEGVDKIVHELPATSPDALILLECDSLERTGFRREDFDRLAPAFTINIDHHRSGRNYADFNWIDPDACAVGAMLYDIVLASGHVISTKVADCLYTAVLTDTGSFNYPGTNAATFALAEHLVKAGTDPNRIAQAMFSSNPVSKLRLLGAALSNMQVQGSICWSLITTEDMERTHATAEDCEGVVNHLISIGEIEAAALLRQQADPSEFRVSLRSKGSGHVDVSAVAEQFHGGGHRNASGCTLHGTIAEVTSSIVAALEAEVAAEVAPTSLTAPIA